MRSFLVIHVTTYSFVLYLVSLSMSCVYVWGWDKITHLVSTKNNQTEFLLLNSIYKYSITINDVSSNNTNNKMYGNCWQWAKIWSRLSHNNNCDIMLRGLCWLLVSTLFMQFLDYIDFLRAAQTQQEFMCICMTFTWL